MEIILASTSPRRIELMAQARIPVRVVAPGCEEILRRGESPARMVRRLAIEKAESAASGPAAPRGALVVIAADTTVVAPDGRSMAFSILGNDLTAGNAIGDAKTLQERIVRAIADELTRHRTALGG